MVHGGAGSAAWSEEALLVGEECGLLGAPEEQYLFIFVFEEEKARACVKSAASHHHRLQAASNLGEAEQIRSLRVKG